jgi:two-component system C4-dicarboxylate transport response regulator DctD
VAATSEDLTLLVHKEVIRVDFYNHFASRVLKLPPLRERKQDLPFLAQHFIETYKVLTGSPAEKLGSDALGQLMSYAWPGNIRELETQIERSCLLAKGPVIERLEVEASVPPGGTWDDTLRSTEKAYLADLLARSGGRLVEAAERSGLGFKTLQRRLKKHGLKPSDFRDLP